jgi:Tfp pilus assembly protein PilV
VGLLALVAAFSYHLRATRYAAQRAEAASLNQRLVEWVRRRTNFSQPLPAGLNDAAGVERRLNEPPLQAESFTPEELELYRRNLQVRRVATSGHRSRLWHIRAQVSWTEQGRVRHCVFETYHRPR